MNIAMLKICMISLFLALKTHENVCFLHSHNLRVLKTMEPSELTLNQQSVEITISSSYTMRR